MGCSGKTDHEQQEKREDIFRNEYRTSSRHPGIYICRVDCCHHFVDISKSTRCHDNNRSHNHDAKDDDESLAKRCSGNGIETPNHGINCDYCSPDKECNPVRNPEQPHEQILIVVYCPARLIIEIIMPEVALIPFRAVPLLFWESALNDDNTPKTFFRNNNQIIPTIKKQSINIFNGQKQVCLLWFCQNY